MVYCGKPSMGCAICRQRKTRCDQATPSCGQCTRANRECPGYRNQLDLMFRNENNVVIEKVKVRDTEKSKKASSSSTRHFLDSSESRQENVTTLVKSDDCVETTEQCKKQGPKYSTSHLEHEGTASRPSIASYFLSPTVEERAQGYFSTNSSLWLKNYDLVDDMCQGRDESDPLFASITAVGLAAYANSVQASQLFNRARRDYVKALQLTNAALRSPTEVRKDGTLFSVMILSMFEIATGSNEDSLEAWTKHINGASALIKLRGPSQLQTRAGQRLFMQATSNIMMSCVQRILPIPDHIIELRQILRKFISIKIWPAWDVSGVIIDFTNFRTAVRNCEIVGPRTVIEAALNIDKRFLDAFAKIPENWRYTTLYTSEDTNTIWNQRYDVYYDSWSAEIWNGTRSCRILLHEIIRDQLLAGSTAITPQFSEEESKEQNIHSIQILLNMQADILASIPSYFTDTPDGRINSIVDASRGYFVLWPLYMAGVMDLATQPIKTWVIGRLNAIASQLGIQQASVLANYLEFHRHVPAWDTKPVPRIRKDGTFFSQRSTS